MKTDNGHSDPVVLEGKNLNSIQALSDTQVDYLPLMEEDSPLEKLNIFLKEIDILFADLERAGIPQDKLLQLFRQETSRFSGLKWNTLDHALEKLFQWPLLHPRDIKPSLDSPCGARVKPVERSILLYNSWGLIKAYGARGFAKGLELGLTQLVQYFITIMTAYRFILLVKTGKLDFQEFTEIFQGSDTKGIDSLVVTLAHVNKAWLKFTLSVPLIIGCLQSLPSLSGSRLITPEKWAELEKEVDAYITTPGGIWRDLIWEGLPFLSSFFSLTNKLQKIERAVRWDGRLTAEERMRAFALIRRTALEGRKLVQINAIECLAKIAHGVGLKDFKRLYQAGYTKQELIALLYTKVTAYSDLVALSEIKTNQSSKFRALPRGIYVHYLLWWLGQSISSQKQSIPFLLFKTIKLVLGTLFLEKIIASVLEAINCPDGKVFQIGDAYPIKINTFTIPCFLQQLTNFRSVNLSDSVEQFVEQMQYFDLRGLTSLTLSYKNLTGDEMVTILQGTEARGATLKEIYIYDYFSDTDMQSLAVYSNKSSIASMELGSYSSVYGGGEGLTSQGLEYLIQVLPFMNQLAYLSLYFPHIDDSGIEALADVLNKTHINKLILEGMAFGDEGGVKIVQALASMPMVQVGLGGSQMGDKTLYALEEVVENSRLILTELWIQGGKNITNAGAQFFAEMIRNSSIINTIELIGQSITDDGVRALTDSIVDLPLQILSIGSQSGEAGMIYLFEKLPQTKIWHLQLFYSNFTNNSMAALADCLPSTFITELLLEHNNLTAELVAQLAPGIAESSINALGIWYNDLKNSTALLAPLLSKMEAISFQQANLNSESLSAFVSSLKDSKLQDLEIGYNQIDDQGVLALTKILSQTLINELVLTNNSITDTSASELAEVYPHTDLQTLALAGNNISSNILYQVEAYATQQYCQYLQCDSYASYHEASQQSSKKYSSNRARKNFWRRPTFLEEPKQSCTTLQRVLYEIPEMDVTMTPSVTSSAGRAQPPVFINLMFAPWRYLLSLALLLQHTAWHQPTSASLPNFICGLVAPAHYLYATQQAASIYNYSHEMKIAHNTESFFSPPSSHRQDLARRHSGGCLDRTYKRMDF